MVTKALISTHYKKNFNTIVKPDFFDYINSRVFYQLRENDFLYFVTFFSKNLNLAEYNYKIYDKELLAIIQYFEQ